MNRTPKRRGRPAVLMFAVKGFGGSNKKVSVLQQITQPLTEMLGASPWVGTLGARLGARLGTCSSAGIRLTWNSRVASTIPKDGKQQHQRYPDKTMTKGLTSRCNIASRNFTRNSGATSVPFLVMPQASLVIQFCLLFTWALHGGLCPRRSGHMDTPAAHTSMHGVGRPLSVPCPATIVLVHVSACASTTHHTGQDMTAERSPPPRLLWSTAEVTRGQGWNRLVFKIKESKRLPSRKNCGYWFRDVGSHISNQTIAPGSAGRSLGCRKRTGRGHYANPGLCGSMPSSGHDALAFVPCSWHALAKVCRLQPPAAGAPSAGTMAPRSGLHPDGQRRVAKKRLAASYLGSKKTCSVLLCLVCSTLVGFVLCSL